MANTQRVVFTFDERSLANLKDMVEQGQFGSMAEAVRESLAVNRALQQQSRQRFTEVVVRNPDTKQERVMVLPAVHSIAKNHHADTPMHVAARGGEVDAMQWLKEQGADVNAKNNIADTPMHLAAGAGHVDAMRLSFELAANKAKVCFIGTPTKDLTFTPRLWENMNRKEFLLTGSWMSYSAPFPGEEWELTARCFADGRLKYDPAMVFRRFPLERVKEAFELFKEPGRVKGKVLLYNE